MFLGLALGRVSFSVAVPITERRHTMFDVTTGLLEAECTSPYISMEKNCQADDHVLACDPIPGQWSFA
jgi:hypothetical protein